MPWNHAFVLRAKVEVWGDGSQHLSTDSTYWARLGVAGVGPPVS